MKVDNDTAFLTREWLMTPNSELAHIFDYRYNDMAVSLCRMKQRERSLLRVAIENNNKCKMCLKVLNSK